VILLGRRRRDDMDGDEAGAGARMPPMRTVIWGAVSLNM